MEFPFMPNGCRLWVSYDSEYVLRPRKSGDIYFMDEYEGTDGSPVTRYNVKGKFLLYSEVRVKSCIRVHGFCSPDASSASQCACWYFQPFSSSKIFCKSCECKHCVNNRLRLQGKPSAFYRMPGNWNGLWRNADGILACECINASNH